MVKEASLDIKREVRYECSHEQTQKKRRGSLPIDLGTSLLCVMLEDITPTVVMVFDGQRWEVGCVSVGVV